MNAIHILQTILCVLFTFQLVKCVILKQFIHMYDMPIDLSKLSVCSMRIFFFYFNKACKWISA